MGQIGNTPTTGLGNGMKPNGRDAIISANNDYKMARLCKRRGIKMKLKF